MGILQKLHSSRNKLSTTMAGKYFSSKAIIILKKLGKLQQDKVHIFSKGYKSFMEFFHFFFHFRKIISGYLKEKL